MDYPKIENDHSWRDSAFGSSHPGGKHTIGGIIFETTPMTRIAIVGNGSVGDSFGEVIETADLVVRFDDCGSCNTTGLRTDVVAVCNTGHQANSMATSKSWRSHPGVSRAKEIWCVRDPRKFAALGPLLAVLHPEMDDLCSDQTSSFRQFCAESGKTCFVIDQEIHDSVDDMLQFYSPEPYIIPSSGMIVVASVLERFPGSLITIAGFPNAESSHYPFATEKRLIDDYVATGKLRTA